MDIPKEKREIGISFLKYCIEKLGCKEKTIFNILIFFLSEQENSDPLYDFLKSQEKFLMEVHFFEKKTTVINWKFCLERDVVF